LFYDVTPAKVKNIMGSLYKLHEILWMKTELRFGFKHYPMEVVSVLDVNGTIVYGLRSAKDKDKDSGQIYYEKESILKDMVLSDTKAI